MRKCNLSNCAAEHEGYCILDLKKCNAKTDKDLLTEDEYEQLDIKRVRVINVG